MMRRNRNILLFVFLLISTISIAQRNTRSPYSMFGIGEIEERSYGLNSGIGGAEIGTRSGNYLNYSNPAGISVDSLYFLFDIYVGAKVSNFYSGSNKANAASMNLRRIALGFRVTSYWNSSVGIRPYSNTEYKITTKTPTQGGINDAFITTFEGDGGLAQIFWGNSVKVLKGLSLGMNASYVFGDVDKTESINLQYSKINSNTRKLFLDFGMQYNKQINDYSEFTLGVTYGYKNKYKYINSIYLSISGIEEKTPPTFEYTPQYFGAGASYKNNKGHSSISFAVDYKFQNWAAIKSTVANVRYENSHRLNGGIKYIPNYRTARKYFQAVEYQIGGYYNKSHLLIAGNELQEYGLTLGARLPLKNRTSLIVSADLGWKGGNGLIKEKYAMFTAGVSLAELWFMKWMYD